MIRAAGMQNGKPTVFLGLSFGNLARFREQPGDTYIKIPAEQLGMSHDIVIFSGRTEEEMSDHFFKNLTPDAKVTISDKFKS